MYCDYAKFDSDAFVAMRFAPKEINDLRAEMSNINVFVELNNVTENVSCALRNSDGYFIFHHFFQFYSKFVSVAPITHLFLSSRRKAIDKLAAKALPQTQKFINDVAIICVANIIINFV